MTLYGFNKFTIKEMSMHLNCENLRKFTTRMLPTSRILRMLVIMLLVVVIQCSAGNQRIVHVSDHEQIHDNKDFFTNGENNNSYICCAYGNCTCNSLDHALVNLTSNQG